MVKVSEIKNEHKIGLFLKFFLCAIILAAAILTVIWQMPNITKNIQEITSKQYSVIKNYQNTNSDLVLYNLEPMLISLKNQKNLNIKITLELNKVEDTKVIEQIMPKIENIILTHLMELSSQEIDNIEGLYTLNEELLYRINLVTYPTDVKGLNFRAFEISSPLQQ